MDDELGSDFARLVGDAQAADTVRSRVRERHLRDAASADATLLGVALDLAEEQAEVTITTDIGRIVSGRITMVAADALAIGASYVPARAVVSIRRAPGQTGGRGAPAQPGGRAPGQTGRPRSPGRVAVPAPAGQRPPARSTTFGVLLGELALERPRVAIGARGEAALLTGELRSAGADVVTLRLDGDPVTTAYLSVGALSLVTLLASG